MLGSHWVKEHVLRVFYPLKAALTRLKWKFQGFRIFPQFYSSPSMYNERIIEQNMWKKYIFILLYGNLSTAIALCQKLAENSGNMCTGSAGNKRVTDVHRDSEDVLQTSSKVRWDWEDVPDMLCNVRRISEDTRQSISIGTIDFWPISLLFV